MIFNEMQELLRKSVREFALAEVAPLAAQIDETGVFPDELYQKLVKNGYLGITIPREYGGSDAGFVAMAIVMEEMARVDVSTTLHMTTPNTLLGIPMANYGTEEQKQKYLVAEMEGEKEGTFALSEPEAGSDVSSLRTTAVKDGDYYILNGRKTFITAAPVADFIVVFAVTDKSKGSHGITAFIIDRGTPGMTTGTPEKKMGCKGSPTSDVILQNCRVHKSQILGKEGEGFSMAMKTLDAGRCVVAAQCLGIAQGAMDEAVKYVKERQQFGRTLSKFQGIQFMLADMETKINCARGLVYDAAQKKDLGLNVTKEAAMAKYYASEICNEVAAKALQLHGGYGYMKDYPIERIFRNARVTTIYEGTSQIQQIVIARQVLK
ncbi:MAG: acyl-CoA dehydrogenase family protein [Clostridia bacterium]|nr:acyl-CoA dehydrogenase family protein [Clostridia bacterium]